MNKYYSRRCIAKFIRFFIISILMIVSDQYTKFLAVENLKNQPPYTLIKDVLLLRYLENTGAAWGILGGKIYIFTPFTILLILVLLYVVFKIEKVLLSLENKRAAIVLQWVLISLISGALGNFIDRVRLGYVIDFIYFKIIDFPTFNVADCCVVISTAILLFLLLIGIKDSDWNRILSLKKSGGESVE